MSRPLHVYGPFEEAEARSLRGAAAALELELIRVDNPAAMVAALEQRTPLAVLIASGCDGSVEVMAHLRGQVRFASVPVLGVSDDRRDHEFGELYAQGGDDLVACRSMRSLVARLRLLVERADVPVVAHGRGSVVVAGTDAGWRATVGRMIANAGLVPLHVNNAQDALQCACAADTRFVVARDDLPPDGVASAIASCLQRYNATPWVVVAPAKRAAALRAALEQPHVAVVDALAPPDHLLFTANELGRSQLAERRAAPRLLSGASVAFRPSGDSDDEIGFSYNVSAGGLYVRTLAPAPMGAEVWLELRAPTMPRWVRLVGHVAWRRAFGPNESATVPPGFGVRLTGGVPGDMDRWIEACRVLAETPGSGHRIAAWEKPSQLPPSLAASTVV
jgi:Tfp pilus assembly protein PilZ